MASPPSPNDLTRQQLDELDALLQKMLALPLAKTDDPPPRPAAPMPDGWRADREPPPPAPHLIAPSVAFAPPPPMVFDEPPEPEFELVPPPEPLSLPEPMLPPAPVEPYIPPAPRVEEPEPVSLVAEVPPALPEVSPDSPPAVGEGSSRPPVHLWPLVAANAPIEWALSLFGPPGRAMCSAAGKWTLGLAGLLMLAAAGLWVARARGLVAFDLPV